MTKGKLNKKEIRKEAKQLLRQGTSKQETFELLVDKYMYSKEIADILRNIPSAAAIVKYGIWNHILLANLILAAVIFLLIAPSIGTLLWYGLSIYGVATKRINYYMWVTVLSAFTLIVFIVLALTSSVENIYWTRTIFLISLTIPSCILPIWLERKLCPKPIEGKEEYTNSDGEQRLKVVYEFPDL